MTGLGGFCNLLYNVHVFYIYIHICVTYYFFKITSVQHQCRDLCFKYCHEATDVLLCNSVLHR